MNIEEKLSAKERIALISYMRKNCSLVDTDRKRLATGLTKAELFDFAEQIAGLDLPVWLKMYREGPQTDTPDKDAERDAMAGENADFEERERQEMLSAERLSISNTSGQKTMRSLFGCGSGKVRTWNYGNSPAIDPNYKFPTPQTPMIVRQLEEGRGFFLTGPKGTGKTTLIEQIAARLNRPFILIGGSDDLTINDLVGGYAPFSDGWHWRDGSLINAMKTKGAIVLIDEISSIRPAAAMALHSVLSDAHRCLTIGDTSEVVRCAEDVVFFLADNTMGSGDETGLYAGTRTMNSALIDRQVGVLQIGYLEAESEIEVVVSRTGIREQAAKIIVSFANITREAAKKNEVLEGVSLRRLVGLSQLLTSGCNVSPAFETAILNTRPPEDREVVRQLWRTSVNQDILRNAVNGAKPKSKDDEDKKFTVDLESDL